METLDAVMQRNVLKPMLRLDIPVLLEREKALLETLPVHFAAANEAARVPHEYSVESRTKKVGRSS